MIKVTSIVPVYEVNGDNQVANPAPLIVKSHWNDNMKVVVMVGETKLTVSARDLIAAIENAINSNRFSG